MTDQRLRVVVGWHMHQPEYRDPATGEFRLPWTYLHAIKDYSDMAAHLEATPQARAVVNFAPLLLEQLDDYGGRIRAHLNDGTPMRDRVLDALVAAQFPRDTAQRIELIDAALRAQVERLINRYPAYRLLASEASRLRAQPEQLLKAPDAFFADLITWYHLAWLGEFVKRGDRGVQAMLAQQRAYSPRQRRELLGKIGELVDGIVPRYRALAEAGRVELSLTPYGHPILPLLLDLKSAHEAMPGCPLPSPAEYPGGEARARWHLERAVAVFQAHFGFKPAGVWCSEGAVSEATFRLLDEGGFSWTATGQSVLSHSSRGHASADRPYTVADTAIRCFFRDDDLSDRIGFRYSNWHGDDAVKDLVGTLDTMAQYGGSRRVVTIFLDGENAWEHYPANGYYFLSALYRQLADHPRLRMTTFGEALAEGAQVGHLAHLVAGSWVYGSFSTWIGSTDKNRGWELLIEAKHAFDAVAASGKLKRRALEAARRQLAICEGSDWFWWLGDENPAAAVSDFERLYRHQLAKLYELLKLPRPPQLDQVLSRGGGAPAAGGVMKPGAEGTVPEAPPPVVPERHPLLSQRRTGVLLHVTSLPGGDFSHDAYRFVELLADCGVTIWQVLPLGPTHPDGSPYLSLSANAGNPMLISLDWLVDRGWLDGYDAQTLDEAQRRHCLARAHDAFCAAASTDWKLRLRAFADAQSDWLDDYALFAAIHHEQQGRSWVEWPPALRDRAPAALAQARRRHEAAIERIRFEQFLFFMQWSELRQYAHRHGVYLFGDLPLFVAHHSADLWAHPELFWVDEHGGAEKIAGVPPDYFSENGQVWGNPLYKWEMHEREQYAWWVRRMRSQIALYDLIRIDHFRGLESCWELPGDAKDARGGRWVKSPGDALLRALHENLHPLPLVAEDLGEITPEVDALRRRFSLPGMRVLQFAFDGDPANVHLPYNYTEPLVAYTGTHDNATGLEWWASREEHERARALFYCLHPQEPPPWPLIHTALGSTASLAMIPLQDLLGLGAEARMNMPGTVQGNWSWRFSWNQVPQALRARLREFNERYGRAAPRR